MPTAIKIWEIDGKGLLSVGDATLAADHVESELETWIADNPDIIGDHVLIIDRQRDIPGVGCLDLLGIDQSGTLVVIELKRDRTSREAVAQALDYASWLDSAGEETIRSNAQEHLNQPLADAFSEYFGKDLPEVLSCQNHRITLVAPRLDASAERIITYLSERYRVDINAVFFQYARLSDGKEIMARTLLVAEETRPQASPRVRQPSKDELMVAADGLGTTNLVKICRNMGEVWTEEAKQAYGTSFLYRAVTPIAKRMIFGVNVVSCYKVPHGQLQVWIRVPGLAELSGVPEEELRKLLAARYPVVDMVKVDCWIRLTTEEQAKALVSELQELSRRAAVSATALAATAPAM